MKKRLTMVLALMVATGITLFAAEIDGTWTGESKGGTGAEKKVLIVMSEGQQIHGTLQIGDEVPLEILEGTMDGDVIAFKAKLSNRSIRGFHGKLANGEITLRTVGRGGGAQPFLVVLKKM